MNEIKRVLIMGANGFIGKSLAKYLSKFEHIHLTLLSRSFSSELQNLVKKNNNVTLVKSDFKDILNLVPVLRYQDIVYHLISASVPATSWVNPQYEISQNLKPTLNFLQLCSDLGVKKVAFASSGETVYGQQSGILNEKSLTRPFSPYGIIKHTIENFLNYYRIRTGLNYDIYRLSNPYGADQYKLDFGVIMTWFRALNNDKPLYIYGDGSIAKDYIYVEDATHLFAHSVFSPLEESNTFNISSGTTTTLKRVLSIMQKVTGKKGNINYLPNRQSDNLIVNLDNSKILSHYPEFKFVSLEEGLQTIWKKIKVRDRKVVIEVLQEDV